MSGGYNWTPRPQFLCGAYVACDECSNPPPWRASTRMRAALLGNVVCVFNVINWHGWRLVQL